MCSATCRNVYNVARHEQRQTAVRQHETLIKLPLNLLWRFYCDILAIRMLCNVPTQPNMFKQ